MSNVSVPSIGMWHHPGTFPTSDAILPGFSPRVVLHLLVSTAEFTLGTILRLVMGNILELVCLCKARRKKLYKMH